MSSSSTATTQPPPGDGIPATVYYIAEATCFLFFIFLIYHFLTRELNARHAPQEIPMQQLRGLSRRILDALSTLTWSVAGHDQSVNDGCVICLSDYQDSDELRMLPCQHMYHLTCAYDCYSKPPNFISITSSSSSTTTTQPPPPGDGIPAAVYYIAAATCLFLFIFLIYYFFTREFNAHAPKEIPMQQRGRCTTLRRHIIDTLPSVTWPADCAICLCEYQEPDKLRVLPFQHVFHLTCVDNWFHSHSSCPMCRMDLTTTRDEEEV